MKKLFLFLLLSGLSGCTSEQYLVGYWKAVDMPQCLARASVSEQPCVFHILNERGLKTGYRVVTNGGGGKPFNGPLEVLAYGHYRVHAPGNTYALDLVDGKFTSVWGTVFERTNPLKD